MNIFYFFAHESEAHESAVEVTQHATQAANPDASIIALIVVAAIAMPLVLHKVTGSTTITINVVLAELFVIGVLGYVTYPALSIVAIVLGFTLAGAVAFGGIASGGK